MDTSSGEETPLDDILCKNPKKKRKMGWRSLIASYNLDIDLFPSTTDYHKWWTLKKKEYPPLFAMAKDFLAIPVTSVPSVQAFSTAGDAIWNRRARISGETIEAKICMENWFENF